MSSEDVAKTVAKKLKFYLDTQRREDAFDLSGPFHPEKHPPALRPGSSLAYDGLHDRSLKHYYRDKNVKKQLQKMKTPEKLTKREKQVRKKIDKTMQEYDYKLMPNKISPYAVPLVQATNADQMSDGYFKPKKLPKRRKNPHLIVGRGAQISRRAPDERIPAKEKERLVNMATKLIVATETIALPKDKKSTKRLQTDTSERLPQMHQSYIERRASSASDPGPRTAPRPPESQNYERRKVRHSKWKDSASGDTSLDSTLDSIESQMQHLNIKSRGDGYFLSSDSRDQTPRNKFVDTTSSKNASPRPKSAGELTKLKPDEFDYEDDFYDHTPTMVSPESSPRPAWTAPTLPPSVDSSTQTVETKGTQTKNVSSMTYVDLEDVDDEFSDTGSEVNNRHSPEKSDNDSSKTKNENRNRPESKRRNLQQRVLTYELFVVTGDKLGAGTSSEVKINLFGEFADSGERPLLRSKTNKNPFERKQVDIFLVDSIYLGDLISIRIGHNGTALGSGWYLDRVVVREGEDATRAFEFKCERWLSARDDDGQIIRDLLLSNVIQGNEVPMPKSSSKEEKSFFKYRPESAGSTDSGKIRFRPLSASLGKQKSEAVNAADNGVAEDKNNTGENNERENVKRTSKKENAKKKQEKNKNDTTGKKDVQAAPSMNERNESEETVGESDRKPANEEVSTEDRDQSEKKIPKEDNIIAVEEATVASKASSSSHSDEDSVSSSDDSQVFSVSSSESDSSQSEEEEESAPSDEEDPVEHVQKDTSKKEEWTEEKRKESLQQEYMAGFLAGVQATKTDKQATEEKKESTLVKGPNIHQASEEGDFNRVKELINEIPELKNKPDERGWAPLHIVSAFGHLDLLKWLSVNGVNLTEETPTGFTAIHLAAMNGHVKCIMVLSAMGCPLSCRTVDESTPLHLAAMSGHVECVKWLLANRANSNVHDIHGRTPLDLAKEYQHDECVQLLQLIEKEMKRKDSVITMLRHPGGKEHATAESKPDSAKSADSGVGGVESGEDGWISDVEDDVIGRNDRPASGKSRGESFGATRARKKSKQEEKAKEELDEKRRNFEKQQQKMQRRESSFLDSIRQEIDDRNDDDF